MRLTRPLQRPTSPEEAAEILAVAPACGQQRHPVPGLRPVFSARAVALSAPWSGAAFSATIQRMIDSTSPSGNIDLQRLRCRREAALAELFAQHRPRLRRMVDMRLDPRVAGRVDPSDVLQEAFMDASNQLQGYLDKTPMQPFLWLRFLTGQRLMALHRRHLGAQKRDAKRDVPLPGLGRPQVYSESLSCQLAGRLTTPSGAVARLEMQTRLHEALEEMEPLDCEILALRHFEELTNNEAAEELGISKAAASKRYVRALDRLRKVLAGMPGLLPE